MADVDLTAAELESSFRKAVEAFNTGDWKTFRELITPDCAYEEVGSDEKFGGADAYLERVKMWKSAFPDIKGSIDGVTQRGTTLAAELRWKGTQTGTLQTPAGAIPATGKAIDTRAVMVVEGDSQGRAMRVRHYTNPMMLMTQLGLMPAAQGATTG